VRRWLAQLVLVLSVTALAPSTVKSMDYPHVPGLHKLVLEQDEIRFTVVIPETYDGQTRLPMVLALHYGGVVTPFYGASQLTELVEPALRETGAIMVAPDNEGTAWDNVAREARVMTLLHNLFAEYPIDRDRILVTGYSLGGIGSWYYAARHPALFSGAIPVSGRAPENVSEVDWTPPIFVIHGDRDDVFPIAQALADVDALERRGKHIRIDVVEGAVHYNVAGFREALHSTVPWIENIWRSRALSE